MTILDKILWVLSFVWTKVVPLLLVVAFGTSIFYMLWDTMQWPFIAALLVTVTAASVITFGLGKLIKLW